MSVLADSAPNQSAAGWSITGSPMSVVPPGRPSSVVPSAELTHAGGSRSRSSSRRSTTAGLGGWRVGSRSSAAAGLAASAPASGSGPGRGRYRATASSPPASARASMRSAASGRPARSRISWSGPIWSGTGSWRSTRAISVPRVVSAVSGTSPVTASIRTRAREYTSARPVSCSPLRLFGRGVPGGAEHRPLGLGPCRLGQRSSEPEVGDAQPALLAEQQVGRLDVAVDEAPPVSEVEGTGRLQTDGEGLRGGEGRAPVEQRPQAAARQVLGDEERHVVVAPVEHRHDVRVAQLCDRLGFGAEATQEVLVVGRGRRAAS